MSAMNCHQGKYSCNAFEAIYCDLESERDRLKAELESEKKESAYWRNIEAKILATDLVAVRSQLSVAKEALKAIEQCADDGYECGGGAYQRSLAKDALQKLGETGGTK